MRNVSQSLRRWTLDGGRTSAGVGTEVTELGRLPILFTSDY